MDKEKVEVSFVCTTWAAPDHTLQAWITEHGITVGLAYKLSTQINDFKERARKGIYDPTGIRYLVKTEEVSLRDIFINCGSDIAGAPQIEVQFFPRFAKFYTASDDAAPYLSSSNIDNLEIGHLLLKVRSWFKMYFQKNALLLVHIPNVNRFVVTLVGANFWPLGAKKRSEIK